MSYLAENPKRQPLTARQLSEESDLPLPTVAKILKALSRAGLLSSLRGGYGGYSLARSQGEISVADIIAAIDGPITFVGCGSDVAEPCDIKSTCPVSENWKIIAQALRETLERLTLERMRRPLPRRMVRSGGRKSARKPRGRRRAPTLTLVKGSA
jgi:Rrf2 family protein